MSETLRDLVVSLSLNSDNFTRNIKSINKQIQEAESAFRLASAGVENFETTTAGLSSKLSTLQRTFQLQQDAVGQYERALQQASDKLQECYTRQNDYAQRLTNAKDKQQQLKTEVASAAQAYKHYKNTLGETDSATIAAKANLDAYKGEYRAAVQEVKKLKGQNVALKKSTQNAADAFSAAQTKLNGAKGAVKETAAEIDQCSRQLVLSRTSWASAGEAIQASQRSIASIGKQMKTAESSYRLAAAGVKDFDKSTAGLTAKLTLLQEKLGLQPYWYGAVIYKCTESLRARKAKQYPAHYGSSRTARYRDDIAKKKVCADCVGLIKGYQWTNGGQGVIESIGTDRTFSSKYGGHGCPDKSANGMFSYAKSKRRTLPHKRVEGETVYHKVWNCRERQKGPKGNGCRNNFIREEELLRKVSDQLGWEWKGADDFDAEQFNALVQAVYVENGEVSVRRLARRVSA